MEVGVFSRTYETGDLHETYRLMKADGIRRTQFNLSNAGLPTMAEKFSDADIERIKKITAEEKIILDVLSGTFNMIDPDEDAREKGIREFKTQCEVAAALNIPIVSLCTGSKNPQSKWKWHDDNLKESSWDDLRRTTEKIIRYAEDNKVILGVETEASNIVCTPEKSRKYLDETGSPNLKIIMDGANLFRPEQVKDMKKVLDEAFEILGKDIVIAHAKDLNFDGEKISFCGAGEGILDFPYYIDLLKKFNYDGALIMHGLPAEKVAADRKFLDDILKG